MPFRFDVEAEVLEILDVFQKQQSQSMPMPKQDLQALEKEVSDLDVFRQILH